MTNEEVYSSSEGVKVTRRGDVLTVSRGTNTIMQFRVDGYSKTELKAKYMAQGYSMCLQDFTDQIDI